MFVLPINQALDAQRMLITGIYQMDGKGFAEDKWLITYLYEQGNPIASIYYQWLEIFLTRERNADNAEYTEEIFNKLYEKARHSKGLDTYPEVTVYQEEVDLINKQEFPLQVKELALLFLVCCKLHRRYKYSSNDFSDAVSKLRKYTCTKRQIRGGVNNYISILKDSPDLFSISYLQQVDVYRGDYTYYEIFAVKYNLKKGKEAFKLSTVLDTPKYFSLLNCRRVCPQCGNEYEYTPNTKTTLCPSCQHKKRTERIVNYVKQGETPRDGKNVYVRKKH